MRLLENVKWCRWFTVYFCWRCWLRIVSWFLAWTVQAMVVHLLNWKKGREGDLRMKIKIMLWTHRFAMYVRDPAGDGEPEAWSKVTAGSAHVGTISLQMMPKTLSGESVCTKNLGLRPDIPTVRGRVEMGSQMLLKWGYISTFNFLANKLPVNSLWFHANVLFGIPFFFFFFVNGSLFQYTLRIAFIFRWHEYGLAAEIPGKLPLYRHNKTHFDEQVLWINLTKSLNIQHQGKK